MSVETQFDARGLKCPMAFVMLKKHLLHHNADKFLLDDKVTLYNFTQYLEKQGIEFDVLTETSCFEIRVIHHKSR